ncbi:MAG: 30S ribosomal protein S4e [Candidatus Aenigmarchaeota archaeon]|nr:30S ribosomal protein S4e [Candidatus Aenigmarchaeota archaeon]
MTHLKRYSMPKAWPLGVKKGKWVVVPRAGPHKKSLCIPLQIVIRDVLKIAEIAKEAKSIIASKKVLIDKKLKRDPNYPVGFMDVVEFPDIKKYYRVVTSSKGLTLEEINEAESKKKICMIKDKTVSKGGKVQLNLHDGRNLTIEKDEYKTFDSILIELPKQKILEHYKLEKSANVVIISGRNVGTKGIVKEMNLRKVMTEKSNIVIQSEGKDIETPKDYIFVTGGKK